VSARPAVAHIVCFGNAWQGDDGFGQHVFRRLGERGVLPRGVAAFDAGTAGLNALHCFEGCAKALIVDAVRTGRRVGTVHRLDPAELEPPSGELTMHDLGVSSLLAALAVVADESPDLVLIGAEVGELRAFTDRLSPPLEAALPTVVRLVLRECEPHP
jgi:hydrogenase maturation protease